MKKLFYLPIPGIFLAYMLALFLPLSAVASESVDGAPLSTVSSSSLTVPSSFAEPTVIGYTDYDDLFQAIPVVEIEHNEQGDVTPLLYAIFARRSLTATVLETDGSTSELKLDILYDWQKNCTSVDSSQPGSYLEKGEILLPDGYALGEGLPQEVYIPVEVIVPTENKIINQIGSWTESRATIAAGSSIEEFSSSYLYDTHTVVASDGSTYTAKVSWDISSLDISVPGTHKIIGTLSPPQYTEFAEGFVPQISVSLCVQQENQPKLVSPASSWGVLQFDWVAPALNMDEARVMLAADEGAFVRLSQDNDYSISADGLELYLYDFTGTHSYQLQVLWENVSTNSFTFTYDADSNTYTPGKDDVSGDRDGGDSNGKASFDTNVTPTDAPNPPPPAVHSEAATSSSSSAIRQENVSIEMEKVQSEPVDRALVSWENPSEEALIPKSEESMQMPSDDPLVSADYIRRQEQAVPSLSGYIAVSGAQLMLMTANETAARFSQDGLTLILPYDQLSKLNISDSDWLYIQLVKNTDSGFILGITLNDTIITQFSDMEIMIPYQSPLASPRLTLVEQQGQRAASCTYDTQSGIATFKIDYTGQYSITDVSGAENNIHENEAIENNFIERPALESESLPNTEAQFSGFFPKLTTTLTIYISSLGAIGGGISIYHLFLKNYFKKGSLFHE